jgi:hypothetical protein
MRLFSPYDNDSNDFQRYYFLTGLIQNLGFLSFNRKDSKPLEKFLQIGGNASAEGFISELDNNGERNDWPTLSRIIKSTNFVEHFPRNGIFVPFRIYI